jgi:hypothetical protein
LGYFFSVYFPKEGKRYPILEKVIILVWLLFFYLSVFTDLILKNIEFKSWGNELISGDGLPYFYLAVVSSVILVLVQLSKKYFSLIDQDKLKIRFFLIGLFISALLNFIFNIFLPIIRGTTRDYQFGDYSIAIIFALTAYAILKRQLFGVKTVLTTFILGLVMVSITLDVFLFTQEPAFRELKIVILIFLAIFAHFLSKSVSEEVKRRQELEQINKGIKIYTEELLKERNLLKSEVREKLEKLRQKAEELEDALGM